jgi:1-deoxy-D-xylulose-5-phosphate reductoisomerase
VIPKQVVILGSTGSIGRSALSVVDTHANRLQVAALAAASNVEAFVDQVARYRPRAISMATREALDNTVALLRARSIDVPKIAVFGVEGLVTLAELDDVDVVLCASSGTAGLDATLAALRRGRTVALANKEVLVLAGALMIEAARAHGGTILPVDSEHNAIHQCLHGRAQDEIRRLILTASGGPFRTWSAADTANAGPDEALRHPTWRMGQKITIDSATLMNKGLEVIEARWLFDVAPSHIDVVIHPQSVVHSMVELCDGSIIAQMGVTDMRLPIQYAFAYPERWEAPVPPLDMTRGMTLEFHPPDVERFRCLGLAYRALEAGGGMTAVLNAANEVAVAAFLERRLPFPGIPALIEAALDEWAREPKSSGDSLKDIRTADAWARAHAEAQIPAFQ